MANSNSSSVHPDGKIDIHGRKEKYDRLLRDLENDRGINSENQRLIFRFLHDCTLGKTVFGSSKKRIGAARCLKYLSILRRLSQEFGMPFGKVGQTDMESLVQRLETDLFRKANGNPYSEATKADIKKTIKKFWKWKDGNNRKYPVLVEWIDSSDNLKDVPAISRSDVQLMIENAGSLRDRALLMVLFDSGARVEELLNVRLKREHIFWKDETGCYMMRLEYSKTKPRTISLPLSTDLLRKWLDHHPSKDDPQAQLFPMSYPALKMTVSRLGAKVLGKRVTPHMLRHSSATYYANRLKNPFKLCNRYGWTMSSNMVNRYLDREGILDEETANAVRDEETASIGKANQLLQEELSIVRESQSELSTKYEELRQQLDGLLSGKGVLTLLMSLKEQQERMSGEFQKLTARGFDLIVRGSKTESV